MLEGRPALQRQGSRKKKEGGLRLPCFFSVCFLSLSSSLLNHYQPRIHGKYYWVHSYHGECIKKTVLFFPKKRQFYFSQEMLLNLELNNFGKKAQEEFFSIHSSCFILLSCTRKVMQYIARWKGNCCPFLVFLGFSQYSLVGVGYSREKVENTIGKCLHSPCQVYIIRYSQGQYITQNQRAREGQSWVSNSVWTPRPLFIPQYCPVFPLKELVCLLFLRDLAPC